MFQSWKKDTGYIINASLLYCTLSAVFSFTGLFLAEKSLLQNPSGGVNFHEIGGHILWGLVAGVAFLGARYVIITILFATLVDSDHLIALMHVEAIPRMSHSIVFGAIAVVTLMVFFGRQDYRLGTAVIAGLLSHISFDIFAGNDGKFPLFVPFYSYEVSFPNQDWIYFEVSAIVIVGITSFLTKRKITKNVIT